MARALVYVAPPSILWLYTRKKLTGAYTHVEYYVG